MDATRFMYCAYVLDPDEGIVCGEQDPELYRGMIYVCDQHRWRLECEARHVAERHFKWLDRERNDTKILELRRARMEHGRFVYYMAAGAYVKIGISQDPQSRLLVIKSGRSWVVTPEDVDLDSLELLATEPGNLSLERQRQQEFREDHVIGERFVRTPRLEAWIRSIGAGSDVAEAS